MFTQHRITRIRGDRVVFRRLRLGRHIRRLVWYPGARGSILRLARPCAGSYQILRSGPGRHTFTTGGDCPGLERRWTIGARWIPLSSATFPVADLTVGFVRPNPIDLPNARSEPLSIAGNLIELTLTEALPTPGDCGAMHEPIGLEFVSRHVSYRRNARARVFI